MDWNDPESRLRYLETHGTRAYNEAMARHIRESIVDTVNGHDIRTVGSRWGTVFLVGATGVGYSTLERAREFARSVSP